MLVVLKDFFMSPCELKELSKFLWKKVLEFCLDFSIFRCLSWIIYENISAVSILDAFPVKNMTWILMEIHVTNWRLFGPNPHQIPWVFHVLYPGFICFPCWNMTWILDKFKSWGFPLHLLRKWRVFIGFDLIFDQTAHKKTWKRPCHIFYRVNKILCTVIWLPSPDLLMTWKRIFGKYCSHNGSPSRFRPPFNSSPQTSNHSSTFTCCRVSVMEFINRLFP